MQVRRSNQGPYAYGRLLTVVFQDFAFPLSYSIDPSGVDLVPGPEKALPPCHRIGTNHRACRIVTIVVSLLLASQPPSRENLLLSLEVQTIVLGRASVLVDELLSKFILDLDEVGLVVSCREALGQFLERGRQPVIGLIP